MNILTRLCGAALAGVCWLLLALITVYRYVLSPVIGPRCRYLPTCSEYAQEALEKHGVLKGGWLAVKRVCRCHPVAWLGGGSGYDPVPECKVDTENGG